jgi:hypothetical protein
LTDPLHQGQPIRLSAALSDYVLYACGLCDFGDGYVAAVLPVHLTALNASKRPGHSERRLGVVFNHSATASTSTPVEPQQDYLGAWPISHADAD